ncbi:MAG: DUF2306 domain-containing protein [Cyclobacteriaceae bacterium]
MKKIFWGLFVFFAIGVGLYPMLYVLVDMQYGYLALKTEELQSALWTVLFYTHISFGGFALVIGWPQFVNRWRVSTPQFHRKLGMIYLIAVGLSGVSGLYIAQFATGGIISELGFSGLAIGWLLTAGMALYTAKNGKYIEHEQWMIRNYALSFAAVSLRIMLPSSTGTLQIDFVSAYQVIAWACWVPNLIIAEMIIRRNVKSRAARRPTPV